VGRLGHWSGSTQERPGGSRGCGRAALVPERWHAWALGERPQARGAGGAGAVRGARASPRLQRLGCGRERTLERARGRAGAERAGGAAARAGYRRRAGAK
jgi:hypothetical protein